MSNFAKVLDELLKEVTEVNKGLYLLKTLRGVSVSDYLNLSEVYSQLINED